MLQSARFDLDGEVLYLFAAPLMLHAQGDVAHRQTDLARLNRARVRRGRPTLFDHRVVTIHVAGGGRARGGGPGTSGQRRAHMVRGHFVRRGKLVFWRSAHWRGPGPRRGRTVKVRP